MPNKKILAFLGVSLVILVCIWLRRNQSSNATRSESEIPREEVKPARENPGRNDAEPPVNLQSPPDVEARSESVVTTPPVPPEVTVRNVAGKGQAPPLQLGRSTPGVVRDLVYYDSLTNFGYGTPQLAVLTYYWAWRRGDVTMLAASLSPTAGAQFMDSWGDKSPDEFRAIFVDSDPPKDTGFLLSAPRFISEEEADMLLYFGGRQAITQTYRMKRFGNEWKVSERN